MSLLDGIQSALNPRSPEAAFAAELAWLLIAVGLVTFLLVMTLAALAVWRRPRWLGSRTAILVGGIAFPGVVVFALLLYSLRGMGAGAPAAEPALRIEVTGHQWWWRVRYLRPDGELDFETANELRIPVGQRVELALLSDDVLHSFWAPNLAGKLDLIPGRVNRLRFTPAEPGTWRGQCAEYCGGAHAQMAFFVVALPVAQYEAWTAGQRAPARGPLPPAFAEYCATCHAIRGTAAEGKLGPDLTHVGSRLSLAAATLPANEGTLIAWITSSQHIKPGNLMPSFDMLSEEDASTLGAFLAGLE